MVANKTIKERGLITTTLPAQWEFEFDKETRKLELLNYFQFCSIHNLITVVGEQSRTALILKFFNYKAVNALGETQGYGQQGYGESGYGFDRITKGGYGYSGYGESSYAVSKYSEGGYGLSGYGEMGFSQTPVIPGVLDATEFALTGYGEGGYGEYGLGYSDIRGQVGKRTDWRLAMRDWLQLIIPSGETDLNELWIAYFAKYSNTPDEANVMYPNLSMEAAYRKFLSQHVAGNSQFFPVFNDQTLFIETSKFRFTKRFNDIIFTDDLAQIILGQLNSFMDAVNISDDFIPRQTLNFRDYYELLDQVNFFTGKGFFDSVTFNEILTIIRQINRAFSDTALLTDSIRLEHYPRFADTLTLADSLSIKYKVDAADSFSMSDSFDKINYSYRFSENMLADDEAVFTTVP